MNWMKRLMHQDSNIFNVTATREPANPTTQHPSVLGSTVVAIGGGKGGVGKSLITANLGIMLSKEGKKVLLVDTDLGAMNLHTFLGVDGGVLSLAGYLKGEHENITKIIAKTPIPGLDLISGAKDTCEAANMNGEKIKKLQRALRSVEYDYVLLDFAPGTASNTLDLFLTADEGIMVTTPEPTSIENSYSFLKSLVLQQLKTIIGSQESRQLKFLLHSVLNKRQGERARTITDVIARLKAIDAEQGMKVETVMDKIKLSIVVNQIKRNGDQDIGPLMKRACHDFFSLKVDHLGTIRYEECVVESIRARMPLSIHYNESQAVQSIKDMTLRLLKRRREGMYNTSHVSFA
jgi:flagellar biosynthesis protein FlhG